MAASWLDKPRIHSAEQIDALTKMIA